MRLLFLIMILMLPAMAQAQTVAQLPVADPDVMRRCQNFAECTLVWGGCGDEAVNKRYVNQFKPAAACDAAKQHNPKAIPTCADGLCVAVVPSQQK